MSIEPRFTDESGPTPHSEEFFHVLKLLKHHKSH